MIIFRREFQCRKTCPFLGSKYIFQNRPVLDGRLKTIQFLMDDLKTVQFLMNGLITVQFLMDDLKPSSS